MAERRRQLLVEARRQRNAWVEEARGGSGSLAMAGAKKGGGTLSPLSPATGGKSPGNIRSQDSAMGLLVESGVTASLPSATPLLDYLGDAIADGRNFGEVDTPIGSMDPTEIPVPTHARMPGSTDYEVLLAKLKHPSAAEVVKSLERFIKYMEENVDVVKLWEPANPQGGGPYAGHWRDDVPASERPPAILEAFLARLAGLMRDTPLWSERLEREEDGTWNRTLVCVESFLHHKLKHLLFGKTADDVKADEAISSRLDSLSFLDAEHLDIKSLQVGDVGDTVQWDVAVEQLRRLSCETGPSAKIDTVLSCSREITKVLTFALKGELPGADDFLPAMILVVKKANPPHLQSNLTFIQEYCPRARLMSEAGYIFTHLASAMAFLTDLDASQLTIDKSVFEAGLKRCSSEAQLSRMQGGGGGDDAGAASPLSGGSGGSGNSSTSNGVGGQPPDDSLCEVSVRELRHHTRSLLLLNGGAAPTTTTTMATTVRSGKNGEGKGRAGGEIGGREAAPAAATRNPFAVAAGSSEDVASAAHHARVSASEVHSKVHFLGAATADKITLQQVGQLLSDYKDLASLAERLLLERDALQDANLAHRQSSHAADALEARERLSTRFGISCSSNRGSSSTVSTSAAASTPVTTVPHHSNSLSPPPFEASKKGDDNSGGIVSSGVVSGAGASNGDKASGGGSTAPSNSRVGTGNGGGEEGGGGKASAFFASLASGS